MSALHLDRTFHRLAGKGVSLRGIVRPMTGSEESIQARAKADGLKVSKLR